MSRLVGTLVAIAVVMTVAAIGAPLVTADTAWNRCLADPPGSNKPGTGRFVEWEWAPPGYVCVYTDKQGGTLGRERVLG